MTIAGVFLINKPVGITSHDVVDRLRKITGERRIGHAGTLDPAAEGLMIVAIGREATKTLSRYSGLGKTYEAEITLGYSSSTYDREGELVKVSDAQPLLEQVVPVVKSFIGKQEQMPPIFSAKKIGGKKAYDLARAGRAVTLKLQAIELYSIEILGYRYPVLKLRVAVSSGAYVRSLAYDLGVKLRTGAYLSALKRTRVGDYELARAADLDKLSTPADLLAAKI
ncbi:MAG: tRNA pseudouridine(55) synthase TruB [bacterium]